MKNIVTLKEIRRNSYLLCSVLFFMALTSCGDYLDVVPDNVATIDHAFRNRVEAQRYKYGCFSFMPDVGNITNDPAMLGAGEIWVPDNLNAALGKDLPKLRGIIDGTQGTNTPLGNYWASEQLSNSDKTNVIKCLWTGIYDCNIFLENIHLPYDLGEAERNKWIGEVKFLKAYLHFWLFRQYGPIPLIKENNSIDDPAEEVQRHRESVDECVDYIVSLLDEAAELLPLTVEVPATDQGLPDKCIALALKAKVLALAASPLFNCNADYANYKDNRDMQLFPQDQSQEKAKWQRAAEALKVAIETAHEAGYHLYDFATAYSDVSSLSEETILSMQVRGAVTEPWNTEIIWGNSRTNNNKSLQHLCSPYFTSTHANGAGGNKVYAPTLNVVEQFYTKNGLPIEDDAEWVNKNKWELRVATANEKQYIRQGYTTIQLHYDREARFYGGVSFDGGTFFGNSRITRDNTSSSTYMWITELKSGQMNGYDAAERSTMTGYIAKKMVNMRSSIGDAENLITSYKATLYSYPVIRLADLYLLYSEVLNEVKDVPDNEVYQYIDLVRARTGLEGVVESWRDYAVAERKTLPLTKDGMRQIIQRERLNELAFEGERFWDLRRWKLAEEYVNQPLRGLSVRGETNEDFYRETVLFTPKFEKKDYFFPIRVKTLLYNQNLLQSPGWQ